MVLYIFCPKVSRNRRNKIDHVVQLQDIIVGITTLWFVCALKNHGKARHCYQGIVHGIVQGIVHLVSRYHPPHRPSPISNHPPSHFRPSFDQAVVGYALGWFCTDTSPQYKGMVLSR